MSQKHKMQNKPNILKNSTLKPKNTLKSRDISGHFKNNDLIISILQHFKRDIFCPEIGTKNVPFKNTYSIGLQLHKFVNVPKCPDFLNSKNSFNCLNIN